MFGSPGCGRRAILLAGAAVAWLCQGQAFAQSAAGSGGPGGSGSSSSSGSGASGNAAGSDQSSGSAGPTIETGGPPTLQAPIGTLLPPLGADPTQPSLRSNLLNAFGQSTPTPLSAAAAGPAWQFFPQFTISEEYTNNASAIGGFNGTPVPGLHNGVNQPTNTDFITLLQPQLTVLENGDRLRVNLFYAPTGEIFAENSSYNQFRQQFSGDILGTVMPDLIYADLRGSVYQQPVFSGLGPFNTQALPPNERETVSSVSASPYIARSFGGTGTLQAGVGYVYSATDAPSYLDQPQTISIGLPNAYGSTWLADRRLFASFTTGEDYGRFQDSLGNDTNFYDGSGPLRNGKRLLVTNDASYAINRFVSALGEIGYENLSYPNEGFSYVGGVWSAGVRVTPNAVSSITAEYRYIDGFYSPYIYGSWQVTPRLHVFGGYSEGITSFDQDQQNSLLAGNITETGVAASSLVAAPLLNNGAFSGSNQGLNHERRLTASAAYLIDRDTVTFTLGIDRESAVGNPDQISSSALQALGITPFDVAYVLQHGQSALNGIPQGAFLSALQAILNFNKTVTQTTSNLDAGVNWHHDLQPTITSNLYLGYISSRQAYTTLTTTSSVQFSAGLSKQFTDKLSGNINYGASFFLNGAQGAYTQDDQTVTISLTRKF